MLDQSAIVAFIGASDLVEAARFYGDVLGLEIVETTDIFATFNAHGTQLRVVRVEDVGAVPYTVLGWAVDDIEAQVDELRGNGVEFSVYAGFEQDDRAIWTAPSGSRIVWFKDPSGNTLSLQEAPAA